MTYPRPRNHSPLGSLGRQPEPSFDRLANAASQPVGTGSGKVGVQATLVTKQGASGQTADFLSSSKGSSSLCYTGSGSGFSSEQAGSGGGHLRLLPGLLRTHFRREEVVRGMEASSRPFPPQRIPEGSPFPNGDPSFHQGFYTPGRLGGFHRSDGRLFPYFDPSAGQKIPPLCLEGEGFPVPCPPVWPGSSSLHFLENFQGASHPHQGGGDQDKVVYGRLAPVSPVSRPMHSAAWTDPQPLLQIGVHPQFGEIGFRPSTDFHIPGNDFRYHQVEGQSFVGSVFKTTNCPSQSAVTPPHLSTFHRLPTRNDGIDVADFNPRSTVQTSSSARFPRPLESERRIMGQENCSRPMVPTGHGTMANPGLASCWRCNIFSPAGRDYVHGRVESRLGGPCRLPHGQRFLEPNPVELAYQQAGIRSSDSLPRTLPSEVTEQVCFAEHGQYHGRLLHQQAGRSSLSYLISKNGSSPSLVPKTPDPPGSPLCSWQVEHPGRRSEQVTHGCQLRMDIRSEHTKSSVGTMVQADGRSICVPLQPSSSHLRLSSPRPYGMENRRSDVLVGEPTGVRLSPVPPSGQGPKESERGKTVSDPNRSQLAFQAVVPGPSRAVPHSSAQTRSEKEFGSSTTIRHSARRPSKAKPSRVASVRKSLFARGASSTVVDLVLSSHRKGTRSVYSSHWKKWCIWCHDNKVDPVSPRPIDISNFLGYLLSKFSLSASSLRVHRAAICSTISQLGGPSFSDDPLLRGVTRGAALEESKKCKQTPAWDLFLVLSYLRSSPFEPIREISLKYLTLKTVFLVTLASGRRGSEIHAIDGDPKSFAFEKNGGISLNFLQDFLAKNQIPGSKSPTIFIDSLSRILCPDDEDRFLCPVRSLKVYLKRTKAFRTSQKRLFISHNVEYRKDVKVQTIGRWLRETIGMAYAESKDLSLHNPRAHEIRAWSASLALKHSIKVEDILQAAYWRSHATFIQHYLRNVSHLKGDGSKGISSVVVAQRAVSAKDH